MAYELSDWGFCVLPGFEVDIHTRNGSWTKEAFLLGIAVHGEVRHHVLDLMGIPWKKGVVCKRCQEADLIFQHELEKMVCPGCGATTDWSPDDPAITYFRGFNQVKSLAYGNPSHPYSVEMDESAPI